MVITNDTVISELKEVNNKLKQLDENQKTYHTLKQRQQKLLKHLVDNQEDILKIENNNISSSQSTNSTDDND